MNKKTIEEIIELSENRHPEHLGNGGQMFKGLTFWDFVYACFLGLFIYVAGLLFTAFF